MSTTTANGEKIILTLPTLDRLGVTVSDDIDVKGVAQQWFAQFSKELEGGHVSGVVDLFLEDIFWRDILALTWNIRTFLGTPRISAFLQATLPDAKISSLKLNEDFVQLQRPYPDIVWIQGLFTFETSVGFGSGVFRIVPTKTGQWKAHVILTNLEDLKGFPERIGQLRSHTSIHGKWVDMRKREVDFVDTEPAVVIVGAGQSGLEVAARLKQLSVPTLVVEKNARIGDNWRGRYEALCLHDVVWYDHMPYLPFPPSWPVFAPAQKLADWLESYASIMELNVWLGAKITKLEENESGKGGFVIDITRQDGSKRSFTPRHVVFAVGLGGSIPNMPKVPGMDEFEGKIIHSFDHKSAKDHIGKKVVVIGACTAGHDIAQDHYENGVDVTMYQRSSTYVMSVEKGMRILLGSLYAEENAPPIHIADLINASYPNTLNRLTHTRITKVIAEADKELLDGLHKVGFKTNFGENDSGFLLLAWERGGGYYLDVGASQLIIDKKIKLKNDSQIAKFKKNSILFENGSELEADVVIFATGLGDMRDTVRTIAGEKFTNKIPPIWGLDDEGEIRGIWKYHGLQGAYFMTGNLALCRFHSKHVALQIKAAEEGILGKRYSE